jgi:SNF2 family DNA or RNA helicase
MTIFGRVRPDWEPHEYQKTAIQKMLNQTAVGLFMDPGLGKTSTVLSAFKQLGPGKKMLVIAPLRPAYNTWPDEMEKWANFNDLKWAIVHGPDKAKLLKLDVDIHIINPEGLLWFFDPQAQRWRTHEWDVLCIDESTKFKATNTRRFKALRQHLPRFRHRWILTGTPVPNGIMDLFGQIFILDQGAALGRYITHFRNRFMQQSDYMGYNWEPQEGAYDTVIERIDPLVIRLSAEDHLDMPELQKININIELPANARRQYKEVEDQFITLLEQGAVVAANAASAGTKCRQIANGAVYMEEGDWAEVHTAKIDAMLDLREELGDKPLLILYEYRHDAERIEEVLGDQCFNLSGASPTKSQEAIMRFNNGGLPVLLGHPASMGHGINLQGHCHHVLWFGITWNLEHYDQANARVYRQGQRENHVVIHHIVAKDTLDERVMDVLRDKDHTQKSLLAALARD